VKRAILIALAVGALLAPAAASASAPVQIRHVDDAKFPLVRVTAVVPTSARPELLEDGHPAVSVKAREFGAAEAIVLAVDNSKSMRGGPLHEAKHAAGEFLAQAHAEATGLVAFGHEALALTRPGAGRSEVGRTIDELASDTQTGTSLYDAVSLSASRLQRMSSGARVLVLLTDGRDLGSRNSVSQAIDAAQRANVVVYAIAVGNRADRAPLAKLATATGGRLFTSADLASLSGTYRALGRELERTWQINFLSGALPGDRAVLTVRAAGAAATAPLVVPGGNGSGLAASIAHSPFAAAIVVLLAALLLAGAGIVVKARRSKSEIMRLLDPHLNHRAQSDATTVREARFESLIAWTETSLADLPGHNRLQRAVERSGLELRVGHVPFLAAVASFTLGVVATLIGAGPMVALLVMLLGLALPLVVLRIAAGRRRKAFDRQLPDVLATVASTLRAGHGLRPALQGITQDGSPPASVELARVLGEERLGRPLDEAIAAMCERVGSPDLDYVATAIKVQAQAGGSMATLFDTLSETVRERQRHARKVKALTSMGRMSATVLICLPIGLAGLMALINRAYVAPFYTTSAGHVLIGVCLASMATGALVLRKIVNVRF
jgi:tight adherence protein B